MNHKIRPLKTQLSKLLSESLKKADAGSLPPEELEPYFEVPREEKFGDLTTPIVLKLSKEKKQSPRPLAEALVKHLETGLEKFLLHERISRITVEGPGFINFYLDDAYIKNKRIAVSFCSYQCHQEYRDICLCFLCFEDFK